MDFSTILVNVNTVLDKDEYSIRELKRQLEEDGFIGNTGQKRAEKSSALTLEAEMQARLATRIAVQMHEQKLAIQAKIRSELEAEYASKREHWKEEEEQLKVQKKKTVPSSLVPEIAVKNYTKRHGDQEVLNESHQVQDNSKDNGKVENLKNGRSDPQASGLADALKELHIDRAQSLDSDGSETTATEPLTPIRFQDEDSLTERGDIFASDSPSHCGGTHILEEKGELSPNYVGRVLGKGGQTIRDLQARSGCYIDINQNVEPGTPCIISYIGRTQEDIDFSKQLVAKLCTLPECNDTDELPLGKATVKQVQVPNPIIGRIIGKGGGMIRLLQDKSQARIQVDHDGNVGANTDLRTVTIIGTQDAVKNAEQMILYLSTHSGMDLRSALGERSSPDALSSVTDLSDGPFVSHGLPTVETETIPCSRQVVGHIIGRKGATIKDLQQRSSCDIQIDQKTFQISITGSRQDIANATSMLHNIMEKRTRSVNAGARHGEESYAVSLVGCPSFKRQYNRHESQGYDSYATPLSPQQQQPYYGEYMMYPYQHPLPFPMQESAAFQHQFPPQAIISHWRIAATVDGQIYYYNSETGETQWEKPV